MSPTFTAAPSSRPAVAFLLSALLFAFGCGAKEPTSVSADLPIEIVNNLVFVSARANGSEPLAFILDTGASSTVIDQAVAERLKLRLRPGAQADTGGGVVESKSAAGVNLAVGSIALNDISVAAIDLRGLQAGLGRPVDGILGYELFQKYVVTIDYVGRKVFLDKPASYRYNGNGKAVPLSIEGQIAHALVQVVGPQGTTSAQAKVEFDIGQSGAATFVRQWTDSNRLLSQEQTRLRMRAGAILNNSVAAEVVRLAGMRMGTFEVQDPVVNIAVDQEAAGVSGDTVGILGGEVLRRFKVIVDYSRSQAILEPNENFDAPMEFDMSGMSLAVSLTAPQQLRVRTLIEKSPAIEAGVAVGDVVEAINGTPIAELQLSAIRQQFKSPGQRFQLRVKRGAKTMNLALVTRRLV